MMDNSDEITSDFQSINELQLQFSKLLNKILGIIGQELFDEINEQILQKCRVSKADDHNIICEAIEGIVRLLCQKIQSALSLVAMDINMNDYRALEQEIQKRQAEIRYHFKIEEQQRLYEGQLTEKIQMLEKQLDKTNLKLRQSEQNLQKLEQVRKVLNKKIQKYEEKLYEINRQGGWNSVEKKSSDKLLHKPSLKIKNRQLDPYLEHASKSRQIITRQKDGSKVFKEKASRMLCFQSIKMREQPNESLPTKKSVSYHGSKLLIPPSKHQLNNSIHIGQTQKRRKLRFARNVTEADGPKQRNSLYL